MTRMHLHPIACSVFAATLLGAAAIETSFAQVAQSHGEAHRLGAGADKPSVGKPLAKIGPPASAGPRQTPMPGMPVVHNAIGVTVPPPNAGPRTGVEGSNHPPVQIPPVIPGTSGGFANPGTRHIANPNVSPPVGALRGGGINGSSFIRPGATPSVLGGPAKPVTGINGTSLRHRQ
jgi:hypothetical protein